MTLTDEQIKEIGGKSFGIDLTFDGALIGFARAIEDEVVKAEREACARLCEQADKSTHPTDLSDAIRRRGKNNHDTPNSTTNAIAITWPINNQN